MYVLAELRRISVNMEELTRKMPEMAQLNARIESLSREIVSIHSGVDNLSSRLIVLEQHEFSNAVTRAEVKDIAKKIYMISGVLGFGGSIVGSVLISFLSKRLGM